MINYDIFTVLLHEFTFQKRSLFYPARKQKRVKKKMPLETEIAYMRNKFRYVRKRQIRFSGFEYVFLELISRN